MTRRHDKPRPPYVPRSKPAQTTMQLLPVKLLPTCPRTVPVQAQAGTWVAVPPAHSCHVFCVALRLLRWSILFWDQFLNWRKGRHPDIMVKTHTPHKNKPAYK